jgi:hypothetical protein
LDHSESSEFSIELSDRVCAIIRKVFFTLNIYLSTEKEVENTNESESENGSANKNNNKTKIKSESEEKISHTSVKKTMLEKAVQGVRYVLSQNIKNIKNDDITSSSLSLINSFICYLPPNQINEILLNKKLENTNLGELSSNLALDSTKIDFVTCDGSVIDRCIEFALSTFSDDINTTTHEIIECNNNDDSTRSNNDNNDKKTNSSNSNNSNNNSSNNDQIKVSVTNVNTSLSTNSSTEDDKLKLKLKLKTEASMTLALLANKVVKKMYYLMSQITFYYVSCFVIKIAIIKLNQFIYLFKCHYLFICLFIHMIFYYVFTSCCMNLIIFSIICI